MPGADFTGLEVEIADLGGGLLGLTSGRFVAIDATAAGWGWATLGAPASAIRVDLLWVVLHELGHVLGLDDDAEGWFGVMVGTFAAGVRPHVPRRCAAPPPRSRSAGPPGRARP